MEKLLNGAVEFKRQDFENHKEFFTQLGRKQEPHTLFIGCSDSRVVPHLITKAVPGELFIVRNIANIVPIYRMTDEFLSTTAAIEYAVKQLNVDHIVVCGHSNCGGCQALYDSPEELKELPHTRKWLELAYPVREKVLAQVGPNDLAEREWLTEQVNVVEQMRHLLTYPFIAERYLAGSLFIHGWHYIIETGEVFVYDKEKQSFELGN